jgi:hypothetical protein
LLARLYSSIAHDPSISPAEAHFMVRTAGDLTYRQFVILSVFTDVAEHEQELLLADAHAEEGTTHAEESLLAELDDLWDRRLLGVLLDGTVRSAYEVIGSATLARNAARSNLRLTGLGATLSQLVEVVNLPSDEQRQVVADLDREKPAPPC